MRAYKIPTEPELVAVRPDALKWQPVRGGALLPHRYRPVRLTDLTWMRPLRPEPDGRCRFAEETGL